MRTVTFECQRAAAQFHNLTGDAEAYTRSFFLSSEERYEDMFGNILWYQWAVVGDVDNNSIVLVAVSMKPDMRSFARGGDGLDGILE